MTLSGCRQSGSRPSETAGRVQAIRAVWAGPEGRELVDWWSGPERRTGLADDQLLGLAVCRCQCALRCPRGQSTRADSRASRSLLKTASSQRSWRTEYRPQRPFSSTSGLSAAVQESSGAMTNMLHGVAEHGNSGGKGRCTAEAGQIGTAVACANTSGSVGYLVCERHKSPRRSHEARFRRRIDHDPPRISKLACS